MARRIRLPVCLVMSLTTSVSCTCICSKAFCMGCTAREAISINRLRGRRELRHLQMPLLQPSAIPCVGLVPRHVLDVRGGDQPDLKPTLVQHCEQWHLRDAGRRDPDGLEPTLVQPRGQGIQVRGDGATLPHGLRIPIVRDRHPVLRRPDIDAGGLPVHLWQGRCLPRGRGASTRALTRPAMRCAGMSRPPWSARVVQDRRIRGGAAREKHASKREHTSMGVGHHWCRRTSQRPCF